MIFIIFRYHRPSNFGRLSRPSPDPLWTQRDDSRGVENAVEVSFAKCAHRGGRVEQRIPRSLQNNPQPPVPCAVRARTPFIPRRGGPFTHHPHVVPRADAQLVD